MVGRLFLSLQSLVGAKQRQLRQSRIGVGAKEATSAGSASESGRGKVAIPAVRLLLLAAG